MVRREELSKIIEPVRNHCVTTLFVSTIARAAPRQQPIPTSLPPPHTQPSRPPVLHRNNRSRNLSRGQQPYPILLPESPPEGDRPIMPHKAVPSRQLRHPAKHSATPLRPLQIVNKPSCLRSRFHPPK